ncbi:hypothetical protein [Mycobacterium sp.]
MSGYGGTTPFLTRESGHASIKDTGDPAEVLKKPAGAVITGR